MPPLDMVSLPMETAHPTLTLNTEIATKYCNAIRQGASRTGACRIAGVPEPTVHHWIEKGQESIEPYMSFLRAILEAEGQLELEEVSVWRASSKYEAKRDFLARRFRDQWGDAKTDNAGLTINIGIIAQPDTINIAPLDALTLPTITASTNSETTAALPTSKRRKRSTAGDRNTHS